MSFIKSFEEITKKDANIAGGKGASLGEMTQAGIPVPPGFVILSDVFERFLEEMDLNVEIDAALDAVDHKEIHTVENASEKIQALILEAEMPKDIADDIKNYFKKLGAQYVAVRSSATAEDSASAAWAGQLDSFLNTTEESLLENVKKCWASLFTPRAIFYRFEKDLHKQKISVAVVVQKMVESEVSGIAFSVHPVTQDRNQLIIEAGFGLGEAIVSGSVTPDSYVAEKNPFKIIDINVNEQNRALYRIEGGGNEWRDIPPEKAKSQVLSKKEIEEFSKIIIEIEKHYGFPVDIEWAREKGKFYIVQSRPITTLLDLDVSEDSRDDFSLVENKNRDAFISELKNIDWIYWLNRPYSVFMATIFWEGLRDIFFDKFGLKGLATNNHLYQFPDIYYDKKFLEKGLVFFDNYFISHKMSDLSDALGTMHKHHVRELKKVVSDNTKTIPQRIAVMSDLVKDYIPSLWIIIQLEEHFNKRIALEVPKYIKGDYTKFVGDICVPKKKNVYVLMQDEIKSGASIKHIKEKYGWLKSRDGFTDFYTEKEIEDIKNGLKDVENHEVDIPKDLLGLAEELQELNFFRTDRTDKFYEFFGAARPLMIEIAKYIDVDFKDLADYDAISIILDKPKRYKKTFSYSLIDNKYLISNEILISDFKQHETGEIKGKTAFKGLVRGIAKVVTHSNDIGKVKEGEVLVAQMTFPSFISAMQKAIAFVTDEGGITCHAAIIAREMKKPCIIGTKNATKLIKDGDLVEVDADKGIVRILQSEPISIQIPTAEAKAIIPDLKNFTLTFSRPQSVLRDEIAYTLFEKYGDIPGLRVMTIPLEETNRAIYVDSVFIKQLFDFLLSSISSHKGFDSHLKNYKILTEDFENAGKEILKTGSQKQELLSSYKKALEVIAGLGDYAWLPIPIEKILVPKFIELLKKKFPDEWGEINHAVSSPVKLYGYQNMRLDICAAVISGQTSSEKLVNELVNKHKWQGEYAYVEPLFEAGYFKTEFLKLTIETAQQEKDRILDEVKYNKKNLEKAMMLIKDKTLLLYARIINEYTYLRTDRVDLLKKLQVSVRGILDRVAEHLTKDVEKSWTRIEVASLLNSEIIDYLSGGFVPDRDSVVGRGGSVYYRTRDEVKVITDVATIQKIRDEMNANTSSIIKGTIAFKGRARGLVKMVFSKADIPKVLPGNILVSRTTMPDYTPAMEIASAFVTEEGGVTSHAAIIARELKKPCIVGTGNCTKILKDGDLVEVDADRGIVTIIKE